MAGWIDWIEEDINCPFCGEEFIALFCEDGDPNRIPIIMAGLASEKAVCLRGVLKLENRPSEG